MFSQLYLEEGNNTTVILISLFINSIQKKRIRSYKNKVNAIWKPIQYISQTYRQQKPVQIAS